MKPSRLIVRLRTHAREEGINLSRSADQLLLSPPGDNWVRWNLLHTPGRQLAPRPSPLGLFLLILCAFTLPLPAVSPDALFRDGANAYRSADYAHAAETFRLSASLQPSSGALQNLGLAEWQCRRVGSAILAWEQALWLDPFNHSARQNLRFARKSAQLEAPELAWYEVVSTWLPVNWWAWIAGASFWLAIAMATLPGFLRRRKAIWHQAVAAVALMVFLLSLPAMVGVQTRARIAFIQQDNTPLRFTPTRDAQAITRLAAGDPARCLRAKGGYRLIRTSRTLGWVEQAQLGLTCPAPAANTSASPAFPPARGWLPATVMLR